MNQLNEEKEQIILTHREIELAIRYALIYLEEMTVRLEKSFSSIVDESYSRAVAAALLDYKHHYKFFRAV